MPVLALRCCSELPLGGASKVLAHVTLPALALLSADGDPTVDSGSGKTDEDDDDDDAAGSLPAFPAPEFADAVVVVAAVVADAAAVAAGGR